MKARRWQRWLAIPLGITAVVVLAACGPEVSDESCETQKNGSAKYTFTIRNSEDSKKVTFHWIVTDDPTVVVDDFNRHGEEITLKAKDTTTRTVTVSKSDKDGKHVQLFWPGPKGDDTFKYDEIKKSPCK